MPLYWLVSAVSSRGSGGRDFDAGAGGWGEVYRKVFASSGATFEAAMVDKDGGLTGFQSMACHQ
jgi:hypothetical protein